MLESVKCFGKKSCRRKERLGTEALLVKVVTVGLIQKVTFEPR